MPGAGAGQLFPARAWMGGGEGGGRPRPAPGRRLGRGAGGQRAAAGPEGRQVGWDWGFLPHGLAAPRGPGARLQPAAQGPGRAGGATCALVASGRPGIGTASAPPPGPPSPEGRRLEHTGPLLPQSSPGAVGWATKGPDDRERQTQEGPIPELGAFTLAHSGCSAGRSVALALHLGEDAPEARRVSFPVLPLPSCPVSCLRLHSNSRPGPTEKEEGAWPGSPSRCPP